MTHEKKKSFFDDILKYWPLIVVVFISLTGYVTMGNIQVAQGKDIAKLQESQSKSWQSNTEQKVAIAEIKTKTDLIYEAIKDIRRNQ